MAKRQTATKREITCTHCEHVSEVSARAMSAACPKCNKRLDLEDHKIQRYHAVRELVTCGAVVIEKKGHVPAPIRAESLQVLGKVNGDVRVLRSVHIGKTGSITGDIVAPILTVDDGGLVDGYLEIGPRKKNKTDESHAGR